MQHFKLGGVRLLINGLDSKFPVMTRSNNAWIGLLK
jgi:hypothetical protein